MPVATSTNRNGSERIIPVEVTSRPAAEDDWTTTNNNKPPPSPVYTSRFEGGKYIAGVEAFLNSDNGQVASDDNAASSMFSSSSTCSASSLRGRKTSLPASLSSGYHRSRDRTRVSAVQRLVERKLAQKEKEREKERDRSLGGTAAPAAGQGGNSGSFSSCAGSSSSFSSRQSFRASSPTGRRPPRDISGSRSENGFMLGAGRATSPSKENVDPAADFCYFGPRPRAARSVSGTRLGRGDDEPIAKTYITIGPGKPTRIREHSPAKSAKLSPEETVTSARERSAAAAAFHSRAASPLGQFDLNRRFSPSPQRKTSLNLSPSSSSSSSNSSSSANGFFNNNSSSYNTNSNKARDVLRTASPLKSTNILKTFRASKSESPFFSSDSSSAVKESFRIFQTETRFPVNQEQQKQQQQQRLFTTGNRRLSVDILNSINNRQGSGGNSSDTNNNSNSVSDKNKSGGPAGDSKRASPESERSSSSLFSTPFSGSTDSVESSGGSVNKPPAQLAQRRISLEQRFQARTASATRLSFSSPDHSSLHSFAQTADFTSTATVDESGTHFTFRRTSTVRTSGQISSVTGGGRHPLPAGYHAPQEDENRLDNDGWRSAEPVTIAIERPVPASRKISLPQPGVGRRPEPAPRRRSLTAILSVERLADEKKEEGNGLYKLKNYREALQKYSEAIDLCPQCVSFYGNRSACYLMLGQPRQALEDARTATNIDPTFTKGWSRIARCSVLLGDTVSARQALERVGSQEAEGELANVHLLERFTRDAQAAFSGKDYRKALYCLEKSLEVALNSNTLKTSRAECLAMLGRYPEAQEAANSVLQFDNLNADAIFVRGLCLYYEDNVDRAFSHFTQVLRLAPDHSRAKEIYRKAKLLKQKKEEGNTAFKAGQLEEAYKLYSEALEIDPNNKSTNAKLYFNRATVAAKQKKTEQSIADCSRALDLDPCYIKALLRRARSYKETEKYEEAVRDYEKVFMLDKTNREYRHMLQEAKLELKKSKRKDFYKILGVERNANDEEIKKAYRKRAMIHHPDRHSGATEQEKKDHEHKFKEVGEAYAILSDEKKRRMYDSGQDLEDGGGHSGYHDIDPNSVFQAFFAGGGHPGMGGHSFPFGGHPGGNQSFSFQFG